MIDSNAFLLEARARRAARTAGFTLVEMLVALLLTAMVMTSVFGVLHDAMTARDKVHNLSQLQRTGPLILDLIESDLRSLAGFNVAGRKVFQGRNLSLGGADADAFDFITQRLATVETPKDDRILGDAALFVRAPLCEVGYRLRQNPREPSFLELWRRESPLVDDDPFTGGTYTKVYDKITNFNVSYFEEAGVQARPEDTWAVAEKEMLPQRLQIDLELEIEPRVEATDRPLDFTRRRSFRRIYNLDPDLNRILLANLRPRVPDVPKADESAAAPGAAGNQGKGGKGGGGPGSGAPKQNTPDSGAPIPFNNQSANPPSPFGG